MRARSIPTNGAVIRALRLAYGIKLYELANDLGITDGTLGKIEMGHMNAQMPLLRKIAALLNVPLQAVIRVSVADAERLAAAEPTQPTEPIAA